MWNSVFDYFSFYVESCIHTGLLDWHSSGSHLKHSFSMSLGISLHRPHLHQSGAGCCIGGSPPPSPPWSGLPLAETFDATSRIKELLSSATANKFICLLLIQFVNQLPSLFFSIGPQLLHPLKTGQLFLQHCLVTLCHHMHLDLRVSVWLHGLFVCPPSLF